VLHDNWESMIAYNQSHSNCKSSKSKFWRFGRLEGNKKGL